MQFSTSDRRTPPAFLQTSQAVPTTVMNISSSLFMPMAQKAKGTSPFIPSVSVFEANPRQAEFRPSVFSQNAPQSFYPKTNEANDPRQFFYPSMTNESNFTA